MPRINGTFTALFHSVSLLCILMVLTHSTQCIFDGQRERGSFSEPDQVRVLLQSLQEFKGSRLRKKLDQNSPFA